MLTRLSVHWAERIVATNSWKGVSEIQFAMRGRINFAQPLNNTLKSFFGSHLFGIQV